MKIIAGLPLSGSLLRWASASGQAATLPVRVRPGDPAWPAEADWDELGRDVGGRLLKVVSPLSACEKSPSDTACAQVFKELKNPYYLGDEPALTQSLGWVGAWTSRPSAYAVAAEKTEDIVAAVNFARKHNLRLVVKGGGHSYMGTSNAADSLLVWTRRMNAIALHEAFVGAGCAGNVDPTPAVTIEAGAIWRQAYHEVTTNAGRYVQGGGCMTVGVAGLVLGGGFGSFSKAFGTAAASLLEAEIVTADGEVKIANACTNPDLFWALKGGGAGFGVVSRLTLRTHVLPEFLGLVATQIKATSDEAYRKLIERVVEFYAESLFNPHWGEQIAFQPGGLLPILMTFQGLDTREAEAVWRPFFDWIKASPQDYVILSGPTIVAAPARTFWDPSKLKLVPGLVISDDRPGAPESNIFWAGNLGETGQVLHGYQSLWLPAALLQKDQRAHLVEALFAAAQHWRVSLHFNKGLAGASAEAIDTVKQTAMNPAVAEAFALAISGAEGPPAYPGVAGHEPDAAAARQHAEAIGAAMDELRKLTPEVGAYVWESNFFEPDWRKAYWAANYPRLRAVKDKYDPDGLFFLHHGVGSEDWSADGFTKMR
ncbi:MAG TPA: FAD-binding oxidoreductase, partial [Roseiarcus sp.]|nr:FAD-binding oxidoreductase [Roseiarcus sp.]